MKCIIEYLVLIITLIKYRTLHKEEKQVTTISEENDKKNKTPIIIATSNDDPLSSAYNNSILGDILNEAFKIMDKEYKLIYCQWAVCIYKLDQCKIWGLIPSTYTVERGKKYWYSDPIVNSKFKFFYYDKEDGEIEYNTLKDLRHYIIGVNPGYFYEQKIIKNFPFIKWYGNTELLLQGLVSGNVQIAPLYEAIGWYYINKNYPKDVVEKFGTLDKPFTTEKEEGVYIMVCKSYPDAEKTLKEFNNALKILKDTGVIQEILEKYGVEQYMEVSK